MTSQLKGLNNNFILKPNQTKPLGVGHLLLSHVPRDYLLLLNAWLVLFHLNVNLISPSPSTCFCSTFSQTLHHYNQTFVCILAHIHLTGCSWMLFSDWTLCVNRCSLKLEGIYEVSLDSNETLINNIISKTGRLMGRDSCKNGLPLCGRGQACRGGWHGTGLNGELACLCSIQLLSTAVTQGLTWLYIPAVSYKTGSDLSLAGLLLFVIVCDLQILWVNFFLYLI